MIMQTYVTLNNNISIPSVGLGVYLASPEDTKSAVHWALSAGYRHIDTAKAYNNEESVGEAIKTCGIDRKDLFITTKLWNGDIREGKTREAFENSLKLLKTDYVDLYLIHWPVDGFEQAWVEMEALYREGKIRAIGVSNFHKQHFEALEKVMTIKPAVNQIESNLYFHNQELIDYCNSLGIAVEVWSPLGGQNGNQMADPVIVDIANKHKKSPAQVIIRWHMQRGVIVIPKSVHKERIESNFDVFDFTLSEEEMNQIKAIDKNQRSGPNPDNFNF